MEKIILNLRLFDGEGGAAAPAEAEGAGDAGGQENALDAAKQQEGSEKKSFEDLIKGEYKKDFDDRVQKIINGRFKDYKDLKEGAERTVPLMDFLSKRFGKDASDADGILNAMMDEDSIWEQQALNEGISTSELKARMKADMEKSRMARENEQLRSKLAMREAQEREEASRKAFASAVEDVKKVYSDFDVAKEMQNPAFVDLIKRGVGMQAAYEVVNKDKILSGAMHYTAQKVSEQVANNINARASRPDENGTVSHAAATTKPDISKMTKADFADIRRRVARGEKISF